MAARKLSADAELLGPNAVRRSMSEPWRNASEDSLAEQEEEASRANPALIVYYLFEDPSYFSKWGLRGKPFVLASNIIQWSINALIIASTVFFCMESMEDYSPDMMRNPIHYDKWGGFWWTMEIICVALFTADLVVRGVGAVAAGLTRDFFGEFMNWIDFLAIAPFYVRIAFPGFADLRFLRIMRLTRILGALPSAKHGSLTGVVADIIETSVGALFIPLYFMTLALIVFSSLMYYVEKTDSLKCTFGDGSVVSPWNSQNTTAGNEGCITEYDCECTGTLTYITQDGAEWSDEMYTSIPDAFWWCMVTFTTVGYGDRYPRTARGKMVCVLTMFCGIFFLSMPLTIVGTAFSESWERLCEKRLKAEAHERQEQGLWKPDPPRVIRNRTNLRAHLMRVTELFEDMQHEAASNGAGASVLDQWEKMFGEIDTTKRHFEHLMDLYSYSVPDHKVFSE